MTDTHGTDTQGSGDRPRLLVIDGHSLAFRAFFALPAENFSTSWGQATNAVWGFARMLSETIAAEHPTHIGVAFDVKGGTFRNKMLPQYKGTRSAAPSELLTQIPLIQLMLQAMCITVIEKKGYEGDDIIGTLATMGENAGFDTLVLSGDRDAFQLIDDTTTVLYPGQHFKDLKHMHPEDVIAKYKVTPQQYPDLAALRGEGADNIPGVPGVGDGYAAKWINQYGGTLESVIAHANEIPGKKGEALRENIDQVRLNRKVNALVRTLDLGISVDDLALTPPDRNAVASLFDRLEFSPRTRNAILKPFPDGEPTHPVTLDLSGLGTPAKPVNEEDGILTITIDATPASDLPAWIDTHCPPATETENTADNASALASADIAESVIQGAARPLAKGRSEIWVLDVEGDFSAGGLRRVSFLAPDGHAVSLTSVDLQAGDGAAIGAAVSRHASSLAVHGYKEALRLLSPVMECPEPWLDTKLAAYLESPGSRQGIDEVASRVLPAGSFVVRGLDDGDGMEGSEEPLTLFDDEFSDVSGDEAGGVTARRQVCVAVRRAALVLTVAPVLSRVVEERGEAGLLCEMECPVSRVLARMESTGAAVDPARLEELLAVFGAQADQAQAVAWSAAGREVNLNSPKQIQGVLFDEFGLKPTKRTKSGGSSTNSDALEDLAVRTVGDERANGFITALLRYREVIKLKQCVETLIKSVDSRDGLIHTTFEQTVTATGRLSSANPNLQNIPNRGAEGREIRSAFVPAAGFVSLLSCDYSQVELRIMAHLSGDEALIEAFRSGVDFHRYVASLVYGVPVDEITADQRTHVKAMSYGLAYGLSSYGLAQQLKITPREADVLKGRYFATFGKVHDYLESLVSQARQTGYTTTMFGRRRYIPDLTAKNWNRRDAAERAALNAPIQGTAADIMKIAMIRADRALADAKVKSRIVLQIHDELVVEIAAGEESQVTALVTDAMEHAVHLSVPLDVSTGIGPDWLQAAH